jgi:hypothetical protein
VSEGGFPEENLGQRLAPFGAGHTDQQGRGPRRIEQRAEQIENRSLTALGAQFARRRNVFESRMKCRREEEGKAFPAQ